MPDSSIAQAAGSCTSGEGVIAKAVKQHGDGFIGGQKGEALHGACTDAHVRVIQGGFNDLGRVHRIADRSNNRIQIFDQDGKFIAEWKQFGRPSGIFIDKDDTMYVADSESTDDPHQPGQDPGYGYNQGCKRGIRIGSAKDGKVTAFIPDPEPKGPSSAAEGVAVDHDGNVYGAEVGPMDLKKYVRK